MILYNIYRLNPLVVGEGCVCKSATRLLSGAAMENHSIMLEHTLVLAGDTVDCGQVWQGWPSKNQLNLTAYREKLWKKLASAYIEYERRNMVKINTSTSSGSLSGSQSQHKKVREDEVLTRAAIPNVTSAAKGIAEMVKYSLLPSNGKNSTATTAVGKSISEESKPLLYADKPRVKYGSNSVDI